MSGYAPVSSESSPPSSPTTRTRRSSLHSIRSFRLTPRRNNVRPDPQEMDAAFDGPDEVETDGLLGRSHAVPGDYDFERDYTLPPSSPPPFQPYSARNPAPGNTNGLIPTSTPIRPTAQRHFLGGLLPSSILPRQLSSSPRVVGGGTSGVFGNLAARPDVHTPQAEDGAEYAPEETQKEGPPSYQAALRDAVPPYWDTTVVLPSSSSPFGPLSSSISGDEILIDGMPGGNFFGFFWNMIVSVSFQFVGFLLTYVLHTTHSAKFGSRVGLGLTMIQFGFGLRSKADAMIATGRFPTDPSDPSPPVEETDDEAAENAIEAIWGPGGSPWPVQIRPLDADPNSPPDTLHSTQEAEAWASAHNTTLSALLGLPTAADVGRANEYFSFMMMSIGWFIILTSLGGYWRVKRFERGLRQAQRESERAQAAANGGEEVDESITTTPSQPGPNSLAYYTSAFHGAVAGANDIRRGFLGLHGPRGHAPLSQDDNEHELLDAQGFGLGPMADEAPGAASRRERGLWG